MVRPELDWLLSLNQLQHVPLLVLATKRDRPESLGTREMKEALGLKTLTDRAWHMEPCSGLEGDGLSDGLKWMTTALKRMDASWKP